MLKSLQPYFFFLLPLLGILLLAPFTPALDLSISHSFYDKWGYFKSNAFYDFLTHYMVSPAMTLAVVALLMYLLSFIVFSLKKFREPCLVLVLTIVLGAGFITHNLLKDHWGRPRPKQVIEFNGKQEFRPFYIPNFFHQPEPSKSFPCGHCTMGFYFFALALILRRGGYEALFYLTFIFALVLGFGLGLARIAQGGHFFSDVLFSAFIMWITAYTCDKYLNAA
jgi:lipid A 4'-phosphatase